METVTLTIDGRQVTVEKGKTVLAGRHRARHLGPLLLLSPRPRRRRLLPRLHRQDREDAEAADVVLDDVHRRHGGARRTRPEVEAARASVFEFLLINHPLDCPVCDKGGECPLQDFSYTFGPERSRMEFPRRVFDGEGVKADVDFGPTLMLNRNRCILCTRCVRFMREIDGDAQIGIVDRGYGSEIATFEEAGRHLAALGQPDGRVPGRRDHHARLPLQVAAVGQPARRGHDLHALLEGLQHDGVDQGQARVGQGRAAHPHDAAAQPGRQRLLDVRHRPLRLPLGRRRPAAAPAAPAARRLARRRALGRCAGRREGRGRRGRRRRRDVHFLVSAHASLEELFVLRADLRPAHRRRHVRLAPPREAAAGRDEVQDSRRSMRRTSAARATSASPSATAAARPTCRPAGRRRRRPGPGALRLRSRARTARSATRTGSWRRGRPARSRRSSCRACCTRRWPTRPTSSCPARRSSRRTRPTRTDRARAGRLARHPPPGDAVEDWQILVEARRGVRRHVELRVVGAPCARPSRSALDARAGLRGARRP